jgi:hypothetical protein
LAFMGGGSPVVGGDDVISGYQVLAETGIELM